METRRKRGARSVRIQQVTLWPLEGYHEYTAGRAVSGYWRGLDLWVCVLISNTMYAQ